jgi:hypothetical protein
VWRAAANWSHQGIARGGHLALTSRALLFQPNRVDGATGAVPWRLPLAAVRSVGVQPVTWSDFFSGGLRRRLRLDLADGGVALLVVNRLDRRVRELGAAVAAARANG